MGLWTLIRLAVVGLLLWLLYRGVRSLMLGGGSREEVDSGRREKTRERPAELVEDLVLDPNCGTYIPRGEALSEFIKDEMHYFCSRKCRDEYVARNK